MNELKGHYKPDEDTSNPNEDEVNWLLLCCGLWRIFPDGTIFVLFFTAGGEGLRLTLPTLMGLPISDLPLPLVGYLRLVPALRGLLLAHVCSVAGFIFVKVLTELMMRFYLERDMCFPKSLFVERSLRVALVLTPMAVLLDAFVFFRGIDAHTWAEKNSVSSLALTLLYMTWMLASSYIIVLLKNTLADRRRSSSSV